MRNGIFDAAGLDTSFAPAPWPWAEEEAERISAHWRARLAEKPKMFDGQVLLLRDPALCETPGARAQGKVLRGQFFLTRFRNFMAWRDFGCPDDSVFNCFSMAALRSSDGAWLLGEMGGHTMNSGKIYFPAGTPDRNDIVGDRVDLALSVAREMEEETGFSPAEAPGGDFRVVVERQQIACIQQRRLALTADEAVARVAAFLARDPDPELTRLVAVRGEADLNAAAMPGFIVTYLRDAFVTLGCGA
ncbi:NUDIX hydrolase [Rhodoblastus acidophilus]|uniref:NUDIX hydrolase n=1 Tax=Rhodoblastus acidophilus TaxID=1074 RepID=A0A6N8DQP8_RHOAC|nr:NUDIX hydrolase [Rhodoblastus acidophilus]MCW2275945.1 8-oxo-dGTP pyrophosphatase MutT (NUDIX family) [Rhodoblastus acidophilus]MTV32618.1 NUDIX hydrolase [Rhodoblastus acidophilus]